MLENVNQEQQGSLERMGIPVETTIDPNVLSVSASKSIRFRISKPKGYSLQEVDDYVQNIVTPSLEWYTNMLHQRDRAVHHLGGELDKALVDVKNLKSQIQFLEYNSQVKDAIELNADDKEVAALMEQLQQARAEVEALKANGNVSTSANPDEIQALNDYIEQVTAQYNTLLEEYNKVKAELETALAQNSSNPDATQELQGQLEVVTNKYEQLLETYQTDLAIANQKNDSLKEENERLQASSGNNNSNVSEDLLAQNAQLEEYSQQVVAQYEELYKRYEEDTQALQKELEKAQNGAPAQNSNLTDNELLAHNAQLEEYSQQVVAQYEELYKRYEEDTQALQKELEKAQNGAPQTDNTELLNRLSKLEEEKAELVAYIQQLESDQAEQEEPGSKLPLPTEEKNKAVKVEKYKDLPPGIRPDDLE